MRDVPLARHFIAFSLCLSVARIDTPPSRAAALAFVPYGFVLVQVRVRDHPAALIGKTQLCYTNYPGGGLFDPKGRMIHLAVRVSPQLLLCLGRLRLRQLGRWVVVIWFQASGRSIGIKQHIHSRRVHGAVDQHYKASKWPRPLFQRIPVCGLCRCFRVLENTTVCSTRNHREAETCARSCWPRANVHREARRDRAEAAASGARECCDR